MNRAAVFQKSRRVQCVVLGIAMFLAVGNGCGVAVPFAGITEPTADAGTDPYNNRPFGPNIGQVDGDGVGDANDNCPTVSNSDQADSNGDDGIC